MASGVLALTLAGLLVFAPASPSATSVTEAPRTSANEPPPSTASPTKTLDPAEPTPPEATPDSATPDSAAPIEPLPMEPAPPDAAPVEVAPVEGREPPDEAVTSTPTDASGQNAAPTSGATGPGPLQLRAADVALPPGAALPKSDAPGPQRSEPTSADTTDPRYDPHRRFLLAGGVSSILLGAGLGVVGFVGLAEVRSAERKIDEERTRTTPDAERIADLEDEQSTWRTAGLATGIVGAALLVTGLTLTGLGVVRAPIRLAPAVSRERLGLQFTGRF